jgi:Core-2/I-Branching enzyme
MKIAYLILAHNNPKHLQRLIKSLSSDSSFFFVHIDRKSIDEDFTFINNNKIKFLKKRISVYWGDFSQVEAIITLIKKSISQENHFDYYVLLSGTDYPLRSVPYIENFFKCNLGKEFINIVQMPCNEIGKPISRLTTFKPRSGHLSSRIAGIFRKIMVRVGALQGERDYRRYLENLIPYGGSTWWALSRDACKYILEFVDNNPLVLKFFKNTLCPDEAFFQTILGNSPFMKKIERNLTFTDWSGGASSPAYISERHVELFRSHSGLVLNDKYGTGEAFFARKFSDEADSIVEKIDVLRAEVRK